MTKVKPLIKICGITNVEQALKIAELGVDAIGVISVRESPRNVSTKNKEAIFRNLKKYYPNIKRVSVIKNLPLKIISENFVDSENVIQLHGDEDIEYCKSLRREIPRIKLWKAFRIKERENLEKIELFSDSTDAFLLDSWNKDTYGGSGIRIESKYLKDLKFNNPWFLAGGISIDWIEYIIKDIKPDGIDISSSIENSPGEKNIEKTIKLLGEIRRIRKNTSLRT